MSGILSKILNYFSTKRPSCFCSEKYFDNIVKVVKPYYEHKGRYYHNWDHIREGLSDIDTTYGNDQTYSINTYELVISWMMHDIIYDVNSDTNEEDSVILAIKILSDLAPLTQCPELSEHIMSTKSHEKTDNDISNIICDLDLMRLGSDWDTFLQNSDNVYLEYESKVSSMEEFTKHRVAFFENLLKDTADTGIFKNERFISRFESKAQANLKRYIEEFGE